MMIMKYTLQKVNELFDVLYSHGIFLPGQEAVRAGTAAYLVCDSLTHVNDFMDNFGGSLQK